MRLPECTRTGAPYVTDQLDVLLLQLTLATVAWSARCGHYHVERY